MRYWSTISVLAFAFLLMGSLVSAQSRLPTPTTSNTACIDPDKTHPAWVHFRSLVGAPNPLVAPPHTCSGTTRTATDTASFNTAMSASSAGDCIEFPAGSYDLGLVNITTGVTIKPQSGVVTFTGATQFLANNVPDITFYDLDFTTPLNSGSQVLLNFQNACDRARVLYCEFTSIGDDGGDLIAYFNGADSEFAYNKITSMAGYVASGSQISTNLHIHHNDFISNRQPESAGAAPGNFGIGWADDFPPGHETTAIFEYNYLTDWSLLAHIVVVKGNGNILRYNIADNYSGTLTVRVGYRNLMYGNYIEDALRGTLTNGDNNWYIYNYVSTTGSAFAYEQYMYAGADPGLHEEGVNDTVAGYNVFDVAGQVFIHNNGRTPILGTPTGNEYRNNYMLGMSQVNTIAEYNDALVPGEIPFATFIASNTIADIAVPVSGAEFCAASNLPVVASIPIPSELPGGPSTIRSPNWLSALGDAYSAEYFVASTGDDSNAGTQAEPFLTVAKCASVLGPGDICTVEATTYYVDNAATGAGNGTSWTDAWTSFAAIDWPSIGAGATIYISGGSTSNSYLESLSPPSGVLGVPGSPVIITKGLDSGHNGEVIIDGQDTRADGITMTASGNDYVHFKNLTVQNHTSREVRIENVTGALVEDIRIPDSACTGVRFRSNTDSTIKGIVYDTVDSSATTTDGIFVQESTNTTIENNNIEITNSDTGTHDDCMQLDAAGGAGNLLNGTIRNNICNMDQTDTTNAQGIFMRRAEGTWDIYNNVINLHNFTRNGLNIDLIINGSTVNVDNNTVMGGANQTVQLVRLSNDTGATATVNFRNNIVTSTSTSISMIGLTDNGGTFTKNIDHNILYCPNFANCWDGGTWSAWQTAGHDANGLNSDPMIASDGQLQVGSPAIDAGVTIGPFSTDINGKTRPIGPAWDIGAFEKALSTGTRRRGQAILIR